MMERFVGELASCNVWRPQPHELPDLNRDEMLRYLGYAGQPLEAELQRAIDDAAEMAVADARPVGSYRAFCVDPLGFDQAGQPCILLDGTTVCLRGRDIYRHLKDARCCILLCCTLGMRTEQRLRQLNARDTLAATLYDAACSAYIEDCVQSMDDLIDDLSAKAGLARNWRFSCGYGDCPLDAQPAILSALNAGRLAGVSATPSNLILPSKSVTAAIGLFEDDARNTSSRPTCRICRLREACSFRARNTTCYDM